MTPTTDELWALVERQDQLMMKLRVCLDKDIPATTTELDAWADQAAAAIRLWIAERERADTLNAAKKASDEALWLAEGKGIIR